MFVSRHIRALLAVAFACTASALWPQVPNSASPPPLTAAQIVDQMQSHNQERAEALRRYRSLRHYQVNYHGFSSKLEAAMDVEFNYDARSGKSYRIVSESGSKALCEKVLRRAIDSEVEAAREKEATALTPANYRFQLAGSEMVRGRPAYILEVEPLVANKFLYHGKIWVDAEDFALVKIDARPAKNPSFWIARTLIQQTFAKMGAFWLPEHNRSETKVRISGTAVFVIDYGTYQIETAPSH